MSAEDRLTDALSAELLPYCLDCLHKHKGRHCDAFPAPAFIPDDIWSGKNHHLKPVPGDGGIIYRESSDKSPV